MSAPLTPEALSEELELFFIKRRTFDGKDPAYPARLIREYATQHTAAQDEEIKELKKHISAISGRTQDREREILAKDERIQELELDTKHMKGQLDADLVLIKEQITRIVELEKEVQDQKTKVKEHHDFCARQDAKRREQLKAAQLERNQLLEKVEQLEKERATCENCSTKLTQVISERDQAFDFLELCLSGNLFDRSTMEALLSTRENEKL